MLFWQWLSTLLLLQLLRWSCSSSMDLTNEEMYFHLHVRVRGDEEIRAAYNTISTYAVELTNTHPTQSLELINIQSDSKEFYFSEKGFPLTIAPFKKIEVPFVFLPHEVTKGIPLENYVHPVTLRIHCDLIDTEFIVEATSFENILATTSIDNLPNFHFSSPSEFNQYQTHVDPIYPNKRVKTEIRGHIIHIYTRLPQNDDFFIYEYFSDNPNFSVIVFDGVDLDTIKPHIHQKRHYVLSVVVNIVDEENLMGFVYFKSQAGDYAIPVNLEGSTSGPIVNVENIDFGIVLADEESLVEPFLLKVYNPSRVTLQILSVAYEPNGSNSSFTTKVLENRSKLNILNVDMKNNNVLPRGETTISLNLINLKNIPKSDVASSGTIIIETNNGTVRIPYQFRVLQENHGLLYKLDDIRTQSSSNTHGKSWSMSQVEKFSIPLYNNMGIPLSIESINVSDGCKSFVRVLTKYDESILVPESTAFYVDVKVGSSTGTSELFSCSIEIEASSFQYTIPLIVKDPPIQFISNQAFPGDDGGHELQIFANEHEIIHIYVNNRHVFPTKISYGSGIRLGRTHAQLASMIKRASDGHTQQRAVFENLAWKDDMSEMKAPSDITEGHFNLLKRIFKRNKQSTFYEESNDSWEGNRNVTIPSGGTARFDLFKTEVLSVSESNGFFHEYHEFQFHIHNEHSLVSNSSALVEVVRLKRLDSSEDLDFFVCPRNSTCADRSEVDYIVADHNPHVLKVSNAHNAEVLLPSSIDIFHPILNTRGIMSNSGPMQPFEVRDLMQFEIMKVPGGIWEIMMRWISCLLHTTEDIEKNPNDKLLRPLRTDDISFSITHSERLIMKDLYFTLKSLVSNMHRVERETLMPSVIKAQELYMKIPSYFWIVNGTISVHSRDILSYMGSKHMEASSTVFPVLFSKALKYKISLPLLEAKVEFQISHLGSASLAYVDVANPSESSIVCSLVDIDKSVYIQDVNGNEPPWWSGGHFWIRNPSLSDDNAMVSLRDGDNGKLLMSTHNVTISSQTGATIHLVSPSLHTSTSFTHSCGARCNLRGEIPTNHANLAQVATGPVTAKWDNGNVQGFSIGASNGAFVKSRNNMRHDQSIPAFAIPVTATKTQIIQGGSSARLGPIIFRPSNVGSFVGRIGISNGWNGLQVVDLNATGGQELLSINEMLVTSVNDEVQVSYQSNIEKLIFTRKEVHKILQLRNSGNLPITFSVSFSNGACRDQAFVLQDCLDDEKYAEKESLPTEYFKIDKYTVPYKDLRVADEDFVTLLPGQHTFIRIVFVQDCIFDEVWTKLLITHKNIQKFRPSVHRIFVGYKSADDDTPCLPLKMSVSNMFQMELFQIMTIMLTVIYLLRTKGRSRERFNARANGLTEHQKAVLSCLTYVDPSSVQLVELSREQGKYNANRAKTKFIESRSVPVTKDLADILYLTTCFDTTVVDDNESFQPIGLNWRAFPKVLHIPKDGNVARLLKSRKQPQSLTNIHEVSNSEDEDSVISSDGDASINNTNEKLDKADNVRRVRFIDMSTTTENTSSGFLKVGSKKVLPRKNETNSAIVKEVIKQTKSSNIESGIIHEEQHVQETIATTKAAVNTKEESKSPAVDSEKVINAPSPLKQINNKDSQNLKASHKTETTQNSVKQIESKDDAKAARKKKALLKKQKKQKSLETKRTEKPSDNVRPPPGLPPPPGFSASPSSPNNSTNFIPKQADEVKSSPTAPVHSVEWPLLSTSQDYDSTLAVPMQTSISRQISSISCSSDEVDHLILQPSNKSVTRQISLNSRMDPTFDDDVSSMGQELPMSMNGFSFSENVQATQNIRASTSDFNVEDFLSSVLDEDIGIGRGEDNIDNDLFFSHVNENTFDTDEWRRQSHGQSSGIINDQSEGVTNWDSGIVLPIIDGTGFNSGSNDDNLPWWHSAHSLHYQTDEDEEIKTDLE